MNLLFYNTFELKQNAFVFLCGDDSSELLSSILAREIAGQGQKVLITSTFPIPYPVEGQILVNIEPQLLRQKLTSDPSPIIYLCSGIENDQLIPISPDFFEQFQLSLNKDIRIIIFVRELTKELLAQKNIKHNSIFITALNYQKINEQLSGFFSDLESETEVTFTDGLKLHWEAIVKQNCPARFSGEDSGMENHVLFLNQVKSIIDENRVIPITRSLGNLYERVFIGDINEYKIREI